MSAFWEARRGRRTKKNVVRHVYAFCYICQPCQTNLNDARPKFGMVAPEFVRVLRRGIYFRQAGLLSLPESLAGVRLGRSKAS